LKTIKQRNLEFGIEVRRNNFFRGFLVIFGVNRTTKFLISVIRTQGRKISAFPALHSLKEQ